MMRDGRRMPSLYLSVVIFTVLSLAYVNQQVEALRAGYRIRGEERELERLLDRNHRLVYNIARLRSPRNLKAMLVASESAFDMPTEWRYMAEPERKVVVKPEKAASNLARLKSLALGLLTAEAHAQN